MSTTEETNRTQFRRTYEEMFNQGNLANVDELITRLHQSRGSTWHE